MWMQVWSPTINVHHVTISYYDYSQFLQAMHNMFMQLYSLCFADCDIAYVWLPSFQAFLYIVQFKWSKTGQREGLRMRVEYNYSISCFPLNYNVSASSSFSGGSCMKGQLGYQIDSSLDLQWHVPLSLVYTLVPGNSNLHPQVVP